MNYNINKSQDTIDRDHIYIYMIFVKRYASTKIHICTIGSGEQNWNCQKNGAEPDLVTFHI